MSLAQRWQGKIHEVDLAPRLVAKPLYIVKDTPLGNSKKPDSNA